MTVLVLRDPHELAGLRTYVDRLAGLDDRGVVRLQAQGSVLGAWGGPPLDVVTLRPVALGRPVAEPVDVTVSAQRLAQQLDAAGPGLAVELPPVVAGPSWVGLLPPRSGWDVTAQVPAAAVHDAVRVAVESFRRRVGLLPEASRGQAALEQVAREVWAAPLVADVPLRAAHAAELTGLLGRDDDVTALRAGAWVRLACPGGSVALRRDGGGTGLGLDLGVWTLTVPGH